MRFRFLLPALCALVVPLGHAHAAPACVMLDWQHGDWCTFEAPAREFVFGGIGRPSGEVTPWIAVQVVFQGQVLASCYDDGDSTDPPNCTGRWQAFVGDLTHHCYVFGTGGPIAHCADPPPVR